MYRRFTKYGLSQLAVLAIVGCSSDIDVSTDGEVRVPVTFELASSPMAVSRADTYVDAGAWTDGESVAVSDGSSVKTYTVSANGSGGFKMEGSDAANTFYWLIKEEQKTFEAWYLKDDASYLSAKPTSMTVAADQTSADLNTYDLLYANTGTLTAASATVATLSFYHQMARLTVSITKGTGATSETVQSVHLGTGNVALTCSGWEPRASNYTTAGTGAGWTLGTQNQTVTMKQLSETEYTCILPPQTIGNGSTVLLTVVTYDSPNNRTYTCTGSVTLNAGNHTTLNTTITRTGITIEPSITAWPASYSDTGSASF